MFPEYHYAATLIDYPIRPDRRAPRASEIRLRVKRAMSRREV